MNNKGFTVIELVAVLVIVGIMFGIAHKKYVQVETTAAQTALASGLTELNSRENLIWIKQVLDRNYSNDAILFPLIDTDLGGTYTWSSLTAAGGTLSFNGVSHGATRIPSAADKPARWM